MRFPKCAVAMATSSVTLLVSLAVYVANGNFDLSG